MSSLLLSGLLFLLTLSSTQLWSLELASSEVATILGGFLHSLLFLFLLIVIGNIEQQFWSEVTLGWFEVVSALLVSMAAAASVHRVCVTTCVLFSCAMLYLLLNVSRSVHQPMKAAPKPKSK